MSADVPAARPPVLTDEQRQDVQELIAQVFTDAPMRKGTKRAFAINGLVVVGAVYAMVNWSNEASAKIATHDERLAALAEVRDDINDALRTSAARDARDIEWSRRLERIEAKLDSLDAILRLGGGRTPR